ncbi:SDR family NAD(P)-dependent oxidoreductase [Salicibibacter cibi]|uniref:SDR family NAD(P)-dependent oxidoreductase n=1 Tax=Salicibibacter cibi TaxID=2743001 RepID=UPI001FE45A00|nr:SDR family NAD(P)-dependent oxidoreductase [Salicibibacter cibi]
MKMKGKVVVVTDAGSGVGRAIAQRYAREEDVGHLIDAAIEHFGTFDILVNNAGVMDNMVPATEIADELWLRILDVNMTGMMRTIRQSPSYFYEKETRRDHSIWHLQRVSKNPARDWLIRLPCTQCALRII